jgi:hypothetical protein
LQNHSAKASKHDELILREAIQSNSFIKLRPWGMNERVTNVC